MGTIILLAGLGFLLVVAEMFLPGLVLGIIGGILLAAAVVTGFSTYGLIGGSITFVVVMVGVLAGFLMWMNYFQKTAIGRGLTLKSSLRPGSDLEVDQDLVGAEGVAITSLRPIGKAMIAGKRLDVVTDGQYIERDDPVVVVSATSSRIIVRKRAL